MGRSKESKLPNMKFILTCLLALVVAVHAGTPPSPRFVLVVFLHQLNYTADPPEMLCVFDLGEILSKSNDQVVEYTDQAIQSCLDKKFNIGVGTHTINTRTPKHTYIHPYTHTVAPATVKQYILEFLKLTSMGDRAVYSKLNEFSAHGITLWIRTRPHLIYDT